MKTNRIFAKLAAVATVGALFAGAATAEELVLGTTMPLAGPFASLGEAGIAGYQHAIDTINAEGGIDVGGTNYTLKLVALDNQGDPNQVAGQVRKLVQQEKVTALLGSLGPFFNNPMSAAADQLKMPMVASLVPIDAWQNSREGGYEYAWVTYLHEPQAATLSWMASDLVETNKKAAIFANSDEDGNVWTEIWQQQAEEYGYEIVYVAKVPVGTTNFGDYINGAKDAGAEILLGQMGPPEAIAAFKQMKALGFAPKVAICERCAAGGWWPAALGDVAEGTLTTDVWVPGRGGPGADEVYAALGDRFSGLIMTTAVLADTVVHITADAIERAGSLDPDAINAAIAQTNGEYSIGHVEFTLGHAAPLQPLTLQWQDGVQQMVFPVEEGAHELAAPMPGLN